MQRLNSRVTVVLFTLVATAAELGNCEDFSAVFDPDGQRVCAVGQPDEVRLSTNMATLECVRLCDDNPECVVFNLYDNTTCETFTCPSKLPRGYQIVEFCKSFRVSSDSIRLYYRNHILIKGSTVTQSNSRLGLINWECRPFHVNNILKIAKRHFIISLPKT